MPLVETVRGPIDTANLGNVLMHEHISDDVIPALLRRGVTEDQVRVMLAGNPRRYFEG